MENNTSLGTAPRKITHYIARTAIGILVLLGLLFIGLIVYFIINPDYTEEDVLARISSEISPSVVKVECYADDASEDVMTGTGLYFVDQETQKPFVETNAHVVLGDDEKYYGCWVYFPNPEDGTFYESAYSTGEVYLFHDIKGEVGGEEINGIDYAQLEIESPGTSTDGTLFPFPPLKPDPYEALVDMCEHSGNPDITIGDKIFLLGYPSIGGDSLTTTNGVVSGFSDYTKQWVKVSAVSNHGNSGGIAVGAMNGCHYGVLTLATFAEGSNLGYLLRRAFVDEFIQSATTIPTYTPLIIDAEHTVQSYLTEHVNLKNLKLAYPEGWVVSTTTNANGEMSLYIESPYENAIDPVSEYIAISLTPNKDAAFLRSMINEVNGYLDEFNTEARPAVFKGLPAYEVKKYLDDSYEYYDVPVNVMHSYAFVYKGDVYSITSELQADKDTSVFEKIIGGIVNSIELR